MARKAYIGVNGVARNIPKMYTGAYFGGSGGRTECLLSGADTLIYSINGRNYKKAYAGDAYAAYAVTGGWLAPLLVSRTAKSVAYYTDGDYTSGIMGYEKTVTFRGATWYVSTSGAAFQTTDIPPTANVININAITGVASFSTREEAALALLNYVNWLPAGDNIARKITKGFVGVDGVARAFYAPSVVRSELVVSTANAVILKAGKSASWCRYFSKSAGTPAICGYQLFDGTYEGKATQYYSPLLIAKDPSAVITYVNDNTDLLAYDLPYRTTIQYRGETWYVNNCDYSVYTHDGTGYDPQNYHEGVFNLNAALGVTAFENADAGALALLKYYHYDI